MTLEALRESRDFLRDRGVDVSDAGMITGTGLAALWAHIIEKLP